MNEFELDFILFRGRFVSLSLTFPPTDWTFALLSTSIFLTSLVMGLTGGPHCIAMCGAACAGVSQLQSNQVKSWRSPFWQFQFGRFISYSALGSVAALSMQALGWLTIQSAALRPLWSFVHITGIVWGLFLLFRAQQPVWLDRGARSLWRRLQSNAVLRSGAAPFTLGLAWAFLPCGLLYSALMVAALSSSATGGALAMGVFAIASGLSLWLGVRLWTVQNASRNALAMRLAGLCLALVSAYGLYMGLAHKTAPWCITL